MCTVGYRHALLTGATALGIAVFAVRAEFQPAWWDEQEVLMPTASANDFALANVGQLKAIAAKAITAMNASLPGGAGEELDQMLAAWRQPAGAGVERSDFAAVNQGQLKAVARLFYDRLAELNYSGPPLATGHVYPWTESADDDLAHAAANLGQIKFLFSFDLIGISGPADGDGDGLPDEFELSHGFDPDDPADGIADFDGDGLSNLQEYRLGADPRWQDTDGDGLHDGVESAGGTDPGSFDSDGDGLSDGIEVRFGSDPNSADLGARIYYLPTKLPMPDGTTYVEATDLSNSGYVSGYAFPANYIVYIGVRWRLGEPIQMETTDPAHDVYPWAVNEAGVIIGGYDHVALRWAPGEAPMALSRGPTHTQFSYGINAAGVIVGSENTQQPEDTDAFVWTGPGLARSNFTHLHPPSGYTHPRPQDINDRGQILGEVYRGRHPWSVAIWDGSVFPAVVDDNLHDAYSISDDGYVVGAMGHGLVVRSPAGDYFELPTGGIPPASYGNYGLKINAAHEVLGMLGYAQRVWRSAGVDEWEVVDVSDWILDSDVAATFYANNMNDLGQLAGSYLDSTDWKTHGVVLTPKVLRIGLWTDANRDGVISGADAGAMSTVDRPFRFWINDDDDVSPASGNDIPEQAATVADSENGVVDSVRDLVDFFPVYLNIAELIAVLPEPESLTYRLSHAEGDLNFVYSNLTPAEASRFQRELLSSGFGPDFSQPAGTAPVQRITAEGIALDQAFITGLVEEDRGIILVEARAATNAPLVLSIERNGEPVVNLSLPLSISGVESMFHQVDLTGYAKEYDGADTQPPEPPVPTRTDVPPNLPDTETNGKYFVFVHGYNVDTEQARGWQAEVFKRLHILGSRARYVGVTWHGATGLDYHQAVFQAFQTGDALKDELAFTDGADVTIAAHSLGNMVVSHAIQSGGFTPSRYYLINAAVPIEAYAPGDVGPGEAYQMTEASWDAYESRLYAANWHLLFAQSDKRSELTWKNLFQSIRLTSGLAYNFYSTEEDVVADADGNKSASIMLTLLRQGFNISQGAWKAQELVKGVHWLTSVASKFLKRGQAGWGVGDVGTPEYASTIPNEELKTDPYFKNFLEPALIDPDPVLASATAAEPKVRYDLLARAIPAMSNAVAANPLPSLGTRNYNMSTQGKSNFPFPTPNSGEWRHSDFKAVALPFVYKMYEEMILQGDL